MKKILCALTLIMNFAYAMGSPSPVRTVSHVDLPRYMGTWHEVASIPQSFQKDCVRNTTAKYEILKDGKVSVLNSCETATGEIKKAEGRAKIVDEDTNAKLKVTFVKILTWIFSFGGNYWVLDLDDNYTYAVVGDPSMSYAWILSRSPEISHELLVRAEKNLNDNGYDTCTVLTSIQSQGPSKREPLCEIVKTPFE